MPRRHIEHQPIGGSTRGTENTPTPPEARTAGRALPRPRTFGDARVVPALDDRPQRQGDHHPRYNAGVHGHPSVAEPVAQEAPGGRTWAKWGRDAWLTWYTCTNTVICLMALGLGDGGGVWRGTIDKCFFGKLLEIFSKKKFQKSGWILLSLTRDAAGSDRLPGAPGAGITQWHMVRG